MHDGVESCGNRGTRLPAVWRVWRPQPDREAASAPDTRHRLGRLPYAQDVDATYSPRTEASAGTRSADVR